MMAERFRNASLALLLASGTLTACVSEPAASEAHRHPGTAGSQSSEDVVPSASEMRQMCEMHRKMLSATEEQRKAMMAERMQGMSPEMREQHLAMMRERCK